MCGLSFLDVDAPGSRQAGRGAGVLDSLGDEDVALPDGVVVRRRAARVRQFDVDDDNYSILVDAPPVDPQVPPVRDDGSPRRVQRWSFVAGFPARSSRLVMAWFAPLAFTCPGLSSGRQPQPQGPTTALRPRAADGPQVLTCARK